MRVVSSSATAFLRYGYAPCLCGIGVLSFIIGRPLSGSIIVAFGIWTGFIAQKLCTVSLTPSHVYIKSGFKEILLESREIRSVFWRGKSDLVKLELHNHTILGQTIWFKAKARLWVKHPHPVVAELRELSNIHSSDEANS